MFTIAPGGYEHSDDPPYNVANQQFRGADILGLNLTPEQELLLTRALQSAEPDYDIFTNN